MNSLEQNSWTNDSYHDINGKILGTVSEYHGQHKALMNGIFIGYFINKEYAMKAIEEAYGDFTFYLKDIKDITDEDIW